MGGISWPVADVTAHAEDNRGKLDIPPNARAILASKISDVMTHAGRYSPVGWLLPMILAAAGSACAEESAQVDFSRDIRPLLSQYCFACHGPDESSREADLRLDRADAALAELASGTTAVVPGKPEASELLARITSDDPEQRMPPAASGHALNDEQIDRFRHWIAAGAKYDDHWSLRPLTQPPVPPVQNSASVRNAIDGFVLARLEQEGVAPSPEADRTTLLRRLSLDLLGLPPQPDEVSVFLSDTSPDAYERLVDRLLASPHFGERWGRHWLDLAHYADSDGYLGDALRPYAWLYRDWVIEAVNDDVPFAQFTIEQLAGDLLPEATIAQRTATGFLRNTLRNTEAGVDLEEYRLKEIVDRVSTVGIGWLGLSIGCAECHAHKFDPISHREFYELFSFFNDADDVDVPAPQPGERERYAARLESWSEGETKLSTTLDELLDRDTETTGEAVKKLGQAPRSYAKSLQNTDVRSEPVPFFHSLGTIDRQTLRAALAASVKQRTTEQKKLVETVRNGPDVELRQWCEDYEKHATKKPQPPSTKAMTIARRQTERGSYVHLRGDYRSRGEAVRPGTPAVLPPLSARGDQADRLDLARWLVDPANPLTPRVTANRIWKHLFGRGLVPTVDNFGTGGEPPSHPELLDALASELARRDWSRKALIRSIVTSSTYRQVAHSRPELERRDPQNVLLARQARFRLEAEIIRDVALSACGLLERTIGGPGIRPPQPAYVTSISRNAEWNVTTGPDLFRRGLYIVFRRATPYPMLLTFDTPDSTVACVQRERSNSPLQALTLLNDPVFFQCAQALGGELASGPPRTMDERLIEGFRRCLGRDPQQAELERLRALFIERRAHLATDVTAARAIIGAGRVAESPSNPAFDAEPVDEIELAAWIITARVLMNLDEFITRE